MTDITLVWYEAITLALFVYCVGYIVVRKS